MHCIIESLLTTQLRLLTLEVALQSSWLSTTRHYDDVIMTTVASQITSLTPVYSNVYSDANQRKHQSSASLAFVWGNHRDRWIPRTKGQLRGKCFHLMTSSCDGNHTPNFACTAGVTSCYLPPNVYANVSHHLMIKVKFWVHPCVKVMALSLDMDINGLTSVLHKYKTPATKCCILTCCWVNLVCIKHLIVKIMPEKHAWGPDFLMSDSPYIFQLFDN